ncbi:hypothetical protein OIU79_024612 [Salix purpurea]|uniref:Uncharacterized protein n=1 Tax=Salix purpurea TaxID=77065 RepID=A0A9Q0SDK9_SALPP|nr:hypothetical protein OIU79_024612 [Salix purpurea]
MITQFIIKDLFFFFCEPRNISLYHFQICFEKLVGYLEYFFSFFSIVLTYREKPRNLPFF